MAPRAASFEFELDRAKLRQVRRRPEADHRMLVDLPGLMLPSNRRPKINTKLVREHGRRTGAAENYACAAQEN